MSGKSRLNEPTTFRKPANTAFPRSATGMRNMRSSSSDAFLSPCSNIQSKTSVNLFLKTKLANFRAQTGKLNNFLMMVNVKK